jgi:hypothetical protein
MIAKELYQLQQEVEKLEMEMASAPLDQREALREKLRKAKADRDRMRRILDGEKEPSPFH